MTKLKHVISNNLYMLKLVHEGAPGYIAAVVLFGIIQIAIEFFSGSFLLKAIVDRLQAGNDIGIVITAVVGLMILHFLIDAFFSWFDYFPGEKIKIKVDKRMSKLLFEKMKSVELSCYENPDYYEKIQAASQAQDIQFCVIDTINKFAKRILSIFLNGFLLFYIDPILIVFALIPFFVGFLRPFRDNANGKRWRELQKGNYHKDYIRACFYSGYYAKEMRLTNMSDVLVEEYKTDTKNQEKIRKKYGTKISAFEYLFKITHEVITVLGVMLYAVYSAMIRMTMTFGDCFVILNSIGSVSENLSGIVTNITEFGNNSLYIDAIIDFLKYEPKIKENPTGIDANPGTIKIENLTYAYDGSERNAVDNVSLTIEHGKKIAIVGENGSGKTTFVKLLTHMYQPDSGSITLCGKDMDEHKLSSWRDYFIPVFQDYTIFQISIAENVLLRPYYPEDEALVNDALEKSGVSDRVKLMKHGIHTQYSKEFDPDGEILSGGEAQKIAISRVFASKSPFIILDEPTSALDPIAENNLFENIMKYCENRTVLFISHRLSSAVNADCIYMFDQGKIAESGTHEELLKKNGKYAEMFRMQAESYQNEKEECV